MGCLASTVVVWGLSNATAISAVPAGGALRLRSRMVSSTTTLVFITASVSL